MRLGASYAYAYAYVYVDVDFPESIPRKVKRGTKCEMSVDGLCTSCELRRVYKHSKQTGE